MILGFKEDVILKLPYLTKTWKIFTKKKGKESYLYMKHAIGFTTNLIEMLEELKKGSFSMIWYNFGIGGRVEIFVNEEGTLEGRYLTPYPSTFKSFKGLVGMET